MSLTLKQHNDIVEKLLKKLKAQNIPIVSIFISGRPLWVNAELNASDAFVVAWLPGTEGQGVADVIFAKEDGTTRHDFKGKLPFSMTVRGMVLLKTSILRNLISSM